MSDYRSIFWTGTLIPGFNDLIGWYNVQYKVDSSNLKWENPATCDVPFTVKSTLVAFEAAGAFLPTLRFIFWDYDEVFTLGWPDFWGRKRINEALHPDQEIP